MLIRSLLVLACLLACAPTTVNSWWLLSKADTSSPTTANSPILCKNVPGLTPQQKRMCHENPNIIKYLISGLRSALHTCEYTFQREAWNCTLTLPGVGTSPLQIASRESAYVYAISAAGVSHSLARACSKGLIDDCGCGETPQGTDPTSSTASRSPSDFVWAGCSDNVKFGNAFGRKFVDQYDRQHATEPRSQMNLHNNRVGRRLLANAMNRECKCHGVSGSCVTKTCWKVMPKFDEFAARLHEKYQLAKLVTNNDQKLFVRSTPSAGFSGRTERYVKTLDAYSKKMRNELIYLDASPNYCAIDVKDRKCGDKCSNICCGRGWTTTRKIVDEPCHHLHSDWCAPTIVNSWWLLSKADTSSPTTANSPILCKNVPGLTPQQKRMCHENPNIIKYLISGLRSALHTCEYTFQREAWNCAELVTNNDPELFVRSTPSAGLSGRTERYVKTLDASSKQMRNELIYLDASPNYCAIDVKDRECGDQFLYICCGRDWRTTREIVDERSYHILPSEIHVKPNGCQKTKSFIF